MEAGVLRVFPRRTNATPDDPMVRIGPPGPGDPPDCFRVDVSVSFSWDVEEGERLAESWGKVHSNVRLGGPAVSGSFGDFDPGMYLKAGHVITSRGCPRHCWFCRVPRYEGAVRELPIEDGWVIHDSNLLACSDGHFLKVLEMLSRQPKRPVIAGGVDPVLVNYWNASGLRSARVDRLYCAYDTPDDLEPVLEAGKVLNDVGFTRTHHLYCYVLSGYPGDTFDDAEARMRLVWEAGFCPTAMIFRDESGSRPDSWRRFGRSWNRPAAVKAQLKT